MSDRRALNRPAAPFRPLLLPWLALLLLLQSPNPCLGAPPAGGGGGDFGGVEGRYSFSLTTFSPDGRLKQVEYASRASSLGPSVAAVRLHGGRGVALASLHSTPTPLIRDDGTSRFVRVTDGIVVGHSGVGADGRVASAAAQRLAVDHAYTFEEDVPIETFLEEVSALFQRYTMRAGSRPFGCSLLVVYVPPEAEAAAKSSGGGDDDGSGGGGEEEAAIYRIDPSGSVELMGDVGCIGGGDHGRIHRLLGERRCAEAEDAGRAADVIMEALKEVLGGSAATGKKVGKATEGQRKLSFVAATLTRSDGLTVKRCSR